jgi:hypothetical protein
MMANDKKFLHAWIVEKLQESNENNFVGLLEIKKKYNSDVTSSAIGNVICQIFMNVKIKSGRSKYRPWSQHIRNLARFQAELFPVLEYHIDVVLFSVPLIQVDMG